MLRSPAHPRLGAAVPELALGAILAALLLADPRPVDAQGRWLLTPSLTLAERYDDNVFATAHDRRSDFITRITPGLALAYEGDTLTLEAVISATAELYADESELDNLGENRRGTVTLGYRPDQRLTLRLVGHYARTNDPSSFLVSVPGPEAPPPETPALPIVTIDRRETSQYTLTASGEYRLAPRWTSRAEYSFALVDEKRGEDSRAHTGRIRGAHDLTRSDEIFATGSVTAFDAGETDTAADVLLGWARRWAPDVRTSLAAGPRVTDGEWGGAAEAALALHPERHWSVTLAYGFGTGLVVGEESARHVSRLNGSLTYLVWRELRLALSGAWVRSWPIGNGAGDGTTDTYGATAAAAYQLTTWLAATLGYQFSYEIPDRGDRIRHHQVTLGLTFSYPFRF